MHRMVRTFVAIQVSPEVSSRAGRLIARLAESQARVRWVDPKHLHLTLKFLGDIDILNIHEICRAVNQAAAEAPPFDLEIGGAGAFPNLDRPRTVWVGIRRGQEELCELQAGVESHLATIGYRPEARRFQPHLTIGRVRDGDAGAIELSRRLADERDFTAGLVDVSEVCIFSSELTREGPIYEPLGVSPLAGR